MLAFLGPVQLVLVFVVVLLLFGPQKMPEIGQQLGRALREVMKAKEEFMNAIHTDKDDPYRPYEPPRYDSYDNSYPGYNEEYKGENNGYNVDSYGSTGSWEAAAKTPETPPGDFAAAAFADTSAETGGGVSASHGTAPVSVSRTVTARPNIPMIVPSGDTVARGAGESSD